MKFTVWVARHPMRPSWTEFFLTWPVVILGRALGTPLWMVLVFGSALVMVLAYMWETRKEGDGHLG